MPEKNRFPAVLEPFVKAKRAQSAADDESWKPGEVSPTLNHFDVGDTRATTVVAFAQNQRDEVRELGDTAGTLNGPGTHQSTYVAEQAVAFKASHYTRGKDGAPSLVTPPLLAAEDKGDQDTLVASAEVSPCLRARSNDPHRADAAAYVAHTSDGIVADPITTAEGKAWTHEGNNFRLRNCVQQGIPAVAQHMAVRRLTPLECERLQGFPDGWTAITYRNKPAADGPRYRALGNSMAVPVVRWIGERIAKVEAIASHEVQRTVTEESARDSGEDIHA